MNLYRIGIFICVLLSTQLASAQDQAESGLSVREKLTFRSGEMELLEGNYEIALGTFSKLYKKHKDNKAVNAKLAEAYFSNGNLIDAEYHFTRASELDGEAPKDFYYQYGLFLVESAKYEKALKAFTQFKEQSSNEKEIEENKINERIEGCKASIKGIKNPLNVEVKPLSDKVNSIFTDAIPALTQTGKELYYTSRRPENKGGKVAPNGQFFEDIYYTTWDEETKDWTKGEPIKGQVNSEEHDAVTSVSADGNKLFIYRNQLGVTRSGDIFQSEKKSNGRWSQPESIYEINSAFFESSACLSPDGTSIYFVSERTKGLGQGDLYVSHLIDDEWTKPESLGEEINTEGDELGVFIHPNGKTLYFASNGRLHDSYGGYDIYRCDWIDSSWSTPKNLGYPINTHRDERHFVISYDNTKGYFTAQRDDEREDLDIYEIDFTYFDIVEEKEIEVPTYTLVTGRVYDESLGNKLEGELKVVDSQGEIKKLVTDEDGEFLIQLLANASYTFEFEKKGFLNYSKDIAIPGGNKGETISYDLEIAMEREEKIEVIDKRLFTPQIVRFQKSSADAEFSDEVKKEFDLFIEQLKKAPSFKVELSGHTDKTGSEKTNKRLSLKRAEKVAKYFEDHGVSKERLIVAGFGSDKPIADNDTEEGRAQNRRVEIRLFEE